NLEVVHLLIRHLHIPAGGIVQFGIDSSRFASMGISKETTSVRIVDDIENSLEIFGSIPSIAVEVQFSSRRIPSLIFVKAHRIVINMYGIRWNPIIAITLIGNPSSIDPVFCPTLCICRHTVEVVIRFADEVQGSRKRFLFGQR